MIAALISMAMMAGGASDSYTLDAPLSSILDEVMAGNLTPQSGGFITKVLPILQRLPEVEVEYLGRPTGRNRFHSFKLELIEPIWTTSDGFEILVLGITKTATFTPLDSEGKTRVESGVDLTIRLPDFICRIIERIAARRAPGLIEDAERMILRRERAILERLANPSRKELDQ